MGDTIFKVVVATVLYLKAFDETKMTVKKGSIVSNNNWANKTSQSGIYKYVKTSVFKPKK